MYGGHHVMWGMHWGWWFFWLMIIAVIVYVILKASSGRRNPRPDNARAILEKRFAAGEISSDEYKERKATLENR